MTKPCRVAIAGCHRMLDRKPGSHNWAAAFAAVPDTQVVAVFDRGRETRQQFLDCWGQEIAAYDDLDQLLRQESPDILCVATRQTLHAEQVEAAVAAGVRGILCDKPLATSLAEADRLLDACRSAGVPLAFGLDRHWWASYRHVAMLIANGIVGHVQSLIAYGVPNLINHGCHWYDTALLLLGSPEPLWAAGLLDDLSGDAPDSRRRMDPPGRGQVGVTGGITLYCTPDGGPLPAFDVIGDQGRLSILNDARQVSVWRQDAPGWQPVDVPVQPAGWPAGPAIVQDLADAVTSGGCTACDVEEARRATEIGFAFHISHASGGARVELPALARSLQVVSFPWGNE